MDHKKIIYSKWEGRETMKPGSSAAVAADAAGDRHQPWDLDHQTLVLSAQN
jgi:hypothetical protein